MAVIWNTSSKKNVSSGQETWNQCFLIIIILASGTSNPILSFLYYHINGLHLLWDSLEWFCLKISSDSKYFFLSSPIHCDQVLIVVIEYYFQIWNKKEHNIIISRVISSHMGPMYIETPSIYIYIYILSQQK